MFEHECELGNAHAHALPDRLAVAGRDGAAGAAREFGAYWATFDSRPLAAGERIAAAPGVTLTGRC